MSTQDAEIRCPFAQQTFPWPRDAEAPLNPPPQYAALREEGPMAKVQLWDGSTAWIVTDMEHFREVLTNPHFSASPLVAGFPFVAPARAAQSKSYQTFITMDPPEHGHYRRMLTREFMAKRMQDLRPLVQRPERMAAIHCSAISTHRGRGK